VARLGGDEFTLLLEGLAGLEEAVETARHILTFFRQPVAIGGREVFVSASIGVAFACGDSHQAGDLLRDADTAMYRAKSDGKSGYAVFASNMNADVVDRMEVETGLRFALERDELRVYYQPLIDLQSGGMTGVEALLRWEHPTNGLTAPGKFIPIAEETGLIVPIGYWVLEEACRQMQEWKAAYPEYGPLSVSVNLSGKQLQRPDVVERVAEVIEKTRIAPADLKIEITESVMMGDVADTVSKLHALKALGVKLAMDDFGTGYSSMASLSTFPLDTVKIDRAFVKRLTENHESSSVVSAIIMLSKALQLDVTGEGIETPEQLVQLQGLGCQIGQGYFFDRPLTPDALDKVIAAGPNQFAIQRAEPDNAIIERYLQAA
ncbi:MAG TPA: GGDEF domain-containing phosphodiesterase, partial [Chthonomonadaceae bacterium]|nr:GGDEF domain-containing phosphodiesterase [Chthonomonadaceae bacterium]